MFYNTIRFEIIYIILDSERSEECIIGFTMLN